MLVLQAYIILNFKKSKYCLSIRQTLAWYSSTKEDRVRICKYHAPDVQ